jgi:hypothetical protein
MGHRTLSLLALFALLLNRGASSRTADASAALPLTQGDSIELQGHRATLTRLDDLPYVQSQYTRRFKFDSFDNPKLKELRDRYHLDQVIAPGRDEFQRQVLLVDWVNHRFKKFGKPSCPAQGALEILPAIDQGNSFFCSQFGQVMVSAAACLGWIDRPLALRRPDNRGSGSTEHTSTEIWSNQYRKWVVLDPTFAMYFEKDGLPLSAYEFRQEWFYRDARDVTFVLDKDAKRYRKSDMPVFRGRYPGFGDLVLDPGATNVYAFIGYVPNTNLLDSGPDYGGMFITKDQICDGTRWHQRVNPADPARNPYFPIDQAALTLTPDGPGIAVGIQTLTPNFKTFMARIDQGDWKPTAEHFSWPIHAGANRLEVKSANLFGIDGPISTAQIQAAG